MEVEVEVVMGKKRRNSPGCLVSDSQIAGIKPPDEPPDVQEQLREFLRVEI